MDTVLNNPNNLVNLRGRHLEILKETITTPAGGEWYLALRNTIDYLRAIEKEPPVISVQLCGYSTGEHVDIIPIGCMAQVEEVMNDRGIEPPPQLNIPAELRKFGSTECEYVSAWRVFVYHGKVVDCRRVLGPGLPFPYAPKILDMIQSHKEAPPAYVMDIGLTRVADTVLIDCSHFYGCGLCGFTDNKVVEMWIAWWDWNIRRQSKSP
jgi:hypothetical protein